MIKKKSGSLPYILNSCSFLSYLLTKPRWVVTSVCSYISQYQMLTSFFLAASTRCFGRLQNFPTRGGRTVISFEIKQKLFVAFSDALVLAVYVLQQHNFTLNQRIHSYGVSVIQHFTIHGDHFLVVAKIDSSVMYLWEVENLKEIHRIKASAADDIHCFTINTRKLMSFSYRFSHKVSIYEWNDYRLDKKIQEIAIKYPYRCNTFSINNITYMACGSSVRTKATVLKWSGSQFQPFQDLPSTYVNSGRPHSFKANGKLYLAIGNSRTLTQLSNDSYIFRWDGTKFVHHQSIPTYCASDWSSFTTSDGQVFLVVANYRAASGAQYNVQSAVYKLANNKFNLYQKLPTTGAVHVHAFTHKGKQYLAAVNSFDGKSSNLNSTVYIWK